jgi:hypothetical protein
MLSTVVLRSDGGDDVVEGRSALAAAEGEVLVTGLGGGVVGGESESSL